MKPKIFVGSSVEGLNVAYAIQQNLSHDGDITVWDQGVFELSKTTIESLMRVLNESDFAVFVFNDDDTIKIRGKESNAIRDNVLFELGLFIGKLSRERVFFIIPDNTDIHIPSDLLGITPGKYNPNREDGLMQAATGPVCNQIRIKIKQLGCINLNNETSTDTGEKVLDEVESKGWVENFVEKEYDKAISQIESQLLDATNPEEKNRLELWIIFCKYKLESFPKDTIIDEFLEIHNEVLELHIEAGRFYQWQKHYIKSEEIFNKAFSKFGEQEKLIVAYGECLEVKIGNNTAIEYLMKHSTVSNPEVVLKLAELLQQNKRLEDARDTLHPCYIQYPQNEQIKYLYAKIVKELKENEIALYLFDSLTIEYPQNQTYWGYLSNVAVTLDKYDLAYSACLNARELSDGKEAWLHANLGNMLKNKGFYTEAIKHLEKSNEIIKNDDYTLDRLSKSVKAKEEEGTKIKELIEIGKYKLWN